MGEFSLPALGFDGGDRHGLALPVGILETLPVPSCLTCDYGNGSQRHRHDQRPQDFSHTTVSVRVASRAARLKRAYRTGEGSMRRRTIVALIDDRSTSKRDGGKA